MKVGYLGLGHMGKAQATRLAERGADLVVWNRTPEKAAGLAATLLDSPARVVESCEVVFVCLFDSAAVEAVLTAEDGVFAAQDAEGTVLIDCTTNSVDAACRFHKLVAQQGMSYLEAPVVGSVGPALEGQLTMLVSGEADTLARVRGLLDDLAREVIHVPEPGHATTLKLANNLIVGVWMAGLAEAVATAEAAGVPLDVALEVLGRIAPGGQTIFQSKKRMLLANEYPAWFETRAMLKDLRFVQQLGGVYGLTNQMAHAAARLYEETEHAGHARDDYASVFDTLRKIAE